MDIKIGCLARFNNPYEYEVEFAKENKFDIMQVWYDKDGIRNYDNNEDRLSLIIKYKFPVIIHALLDINDIESNIRKLIDICKKINQNELIIHPICHSEEITDKTICKLAKIMKKAVDAASKEDINIFLENNSMLDPIFCSVDEVKYMFNENPKLVFLIDIAHIKDYNQLIEMVKVKMPKYLHITDSHFNVIHQHLPLGEGEIDFKYIFTDILSDFNGTAIFEVCPKDEDIINSNKILRQAIEK